MSLKFLGKLGTSVTSMSSLLQDKLGATICSSISWNSLIVLETRSGLHVIESFLWRHAIIRIATIAFGHGSLNRHPLASQTRDQKDQRKRGLRSVRLFRAVKGPEKRTLPFSRRDRSRSSSVGRSSTKVPNPLEVTLRFKREKSLSLSTMEVAHERRQSIDTASHSCNMISSCWLFNVSLQTFPGDPLEDTSPCGDQLVRLDWYQDSPFSIFWMFADVRRPTKPTRD